MSFFYILFRFINCHIVKPFLIRLSVVQCNFLYSSQNDKEVCVELFGKESTVLGGFLIANNWQWIGYWMLIYLAALQSIPGDLYEAAKVDGASALRQFLRITLPMLAPAMTICIVGITTGSLKVYDLLVSSTNGGPGRASTSIIYYTYSTAINGRQYGYGSALTISVVAALLLVAFLQVKVLKKREVQM